jgi:hypothetical protein
VSESYRDDHAARQQRILELKGEVREAEQRLVKDHELLADLAERIAALEGGAEPPAPRVEVAAPAPESDAQARPTSPRSFAPWVLGAGLCALFAAGFVAQRHPVGPEPERPHAAAAPLAGLTGAPHHVVPEEVLPHAKELALPGSRLSSIHAAYVASDGTLDLDAPAGHGRSRLEATYVIEPPPAPVDPSAPLGAPKPMREPYRGSMVELDLAGYRVSNEGTGGVLGFTYASTPVPDPHCTTREVWAAAMRAGAPSNAVAQLSYEASFSGAKASWSFKIDDTSYAFTIGDPECRVLTPREIVGR